MAHVLRSSPWAVSGRSPAPPPPGALPAMLVVPGTLAPCRFPCVACWLVLLMPGSRPLGPSEVAWLEGREPLVEGRRSVESPLGARELGA